MSEFTPATSIPYSDITATNTISSTNAAVTVNTNGSAHLGIYTSGIWSATLKIEGTIDGTDWFSIGVFPIDSGIAGQTVSSALSSDTIIVNGQYKRAENIILENKDAMIRLAEALLEHETLDAVQIRRVVAGKIHAS